MTIQFRNIHKTYADGKTALTKINLTLEENRIYGLLGRNGAGKTTLMHLLTAQLLPTSGSIEINGQSPFENDALQQQICFVKESQPQPFKKNFRIRELLKLASLFYPTWDHDLAMEMLAEFELDPSKKMSSLSRGMESAVGIIIGLAARAPITVYDEPYLGLDAVSRKIFYDRLLQDFIDHPRTIIMSTHLIDEVSKLFEHVIMIHQGQIILDEEVDAILARAYTLEGNTDSINTLADDARIVHIETFGRSAYASWFGEMNEEDRDQLASLGIEISDMPLQQLLVQLTRDAKKEVRL